MLSLLSVETVTALGIQGSTEQLTATVTATVTSTADDSTYIYTSTWLSISTVSTYDLLNCTTTLFSLVDGAYPTPPAVIQNKSHGQLAAMPARLVDVTVTVTTTEIVSAKHSSTVVETITKTHRRYACTSTLLDLVLPPTTSTSTAWGTGYSQTTTTLVPTTCLLVYQVNWQGETSGPYTQTPYFSGYLLTPTTPTKPLSVPISTMLSPEILSSKKVNRATASIAENVTTTKTQTLQLSYTTGIYLITTLPGTWLTSKGSCTAFQTQYIGPVGWP